MALSSRASSYLRKSKREEFALTESEIRNIFLNNGAPCFEPLIEFQQRFGGYIFYAGLAPIKFSVLKGGGGYPRSNYTATIEFEESGLASPQYYSDCADTNYQMQFFLDENGMYYEDYEPVAASFEKVIEHLPLWEEMNFTQGLELIFRDHRLKTADVDRKLELEPISEASDQYTRWFRNEFIYMKQWQGLTTLVANTDLFQKRRCWNCSR